MGRRPIDLYLRDGVQIGSPYDLRHVFGAEALSAEKLEIVQLLVMRHRKITTTQTYARI